MEGIRIIGYTDNTKEGVRKKKVQNTINRIDHMIYEIHQRAEELQYRVQDLEEYIDYMEDVKEQLEKNGKVDKNDLRECEFLYDEIEVPF
jgi:predicted ribosome quality control (RQC) complex YloA/Tae2 family protein